MIIDPTTNRTFDHDRMLETLEDWTRQEPIRQAMLRSGLADPPGIVKLAIAVRLANENRKGGLTEEQATHVILHMLGTKKVRKAIAKHVASQYGFTKWEVTRELLTLAEEMADRIPEKREH